MRSAGGDWVGQSGNAAGPAENFGKKLGTSPSHYLQSLQRLEKLAKAARARKAAKAARARKGCEGPSVFVKQTKQTSLDGASRGIPGVCP
jgi:hypothetical protein